jgi:uncharacterized membrane protein YccF (DUF307 family)
MSLLGNLLWVLLGGGLLLFLEYLAGGLVLCLTIVGIPFGVQCFRMALLALLPFGKEVTRAEKPAGCLTISLNILWILAGGIWVALTHLVFAVLCALTIIGLPFALQHLKLASFALVPFGTEIR